MGAVWVLCCCCVGAGLQRTIECFSPAFRHFSTCHDNFSPKPLNFSPKVSYPTLFRNAFVTPPLFGLYERLYPPHPTRPASRWASPPCQPPPPRPDPPPHQASRSPPGPPSHPPPGQPPHPPIRPTLETQAASSSSAQVPTRRAARRLLPCWTTQCLGLHSLLTCVYYSPTNFLNTPMGGRLGAACERRGDCI